jgi:hypothetical protein
MFQRKLRESGHKARQRYPALLITGPRQSGKTTFARSEFADLPYVNLESPLERADFHSDPLGFLNRFPDGAVLDEAHHVPELLSYLQVRIDEDRRMGRWVLTGSQQIELVRGASQSLAGRVAVLELLPFSHQELAEARRRPTSPDQAILWGGYPPLYDAERDLEPSDWLENYAATFVHRDVRSVLDPRNPQAFDLFLRLCAARTGQQLNKSDLASHCGVNQKTIGAWVDALVACYVVRLVRPYHRNFGKRLVKRPKLYFLDSGLACRLLHIADVQQLSTHPLRGALFETWSYNEVLKFFAHRGRRDPLWYWRTSDGVEIDLLLQRGRVIHPIEIKSGLTPSAQSAHGINKLNELGARDAEVEIGKGLVLFGGSEERPGSRADFVPWSSVAEGVGRLG